MFSVLFCFVLYFFFFRLFKNYLKRHIESDDNVISIVRSFFFGDVSSKRDPKAYLTYISALYDYYRKKYCTLNNRENPTKNGLPLVVNTPGWVKGIVPLIIQFCVAWYRLPTTSFLKKFIDLGLLFVN